MPFTLLPVKTPILIFGLGAWRNVTKLDGVPRFENRCSPALSMTSDLVSNDGPVCLYLLEKY